MSAHSPDIESAIEAWPDRSLHIVEQIVAHEIELDILHPGWREHKPFDRAEYATKARIKWLLKKRSLLTHIDNGQPAPLEWDVLIVRDGRNPKKCYAHPVIPAKSGIEPVTRNPPSPVAGRLAAIHAASLPEAGSAGDIAKKLTLSVSRVERILATKPSGWMDTDLAWVKKSLTPIKKSAKKSAKKSVKKVKKVTPTPTAEDKS